ncbi:structural maintenance of chromosomes protein 3 [Dorcoceras hygrometricum]|uniref:Structural maintenance of chromosomes protein 3 n=1 Tax=Dorcoceras hygrometricum TaxID=472368 RepID=A0A2Z7ALQ5_9LAMI|nr:structural maintenance of chromosomes protein 3 [Dorcoceras hygrometricum]
MTFRVVRTNQYNQDLGLIHSTNGNHLESPNEGSLIDHQVTIYLHTENITMFPTNETCVYQDAHTVSDVQKLHLNYVKKVVLAQGVTAGAESLEIRKEFKALDAKINSLDVQVAAIRNEQLEFQTKIAADILSLSTLLDDIVDYIRGGDAKKGEGSSSRRPLPTPVHQSEGTGDALGTASVRYCIYVNLSKVDISNILSVIVQDRSVATGFDSVVQSSPVLLLTDSSSVFANKNDQMDMDHRSYSPDLSDDSSMHFVEDDIHLGDDVASNQPSLSIVSTNFSASFDDLRASISQLIATQKKDKRRIDDAQNDILSKLNTLEKDILAALKQHEEANIIHSAFVTSDLADVRKEQKAQRAMLEEVKEINAKVTELDEQVATIRNDLLNFHAKAEENHLNLSTQLGFLVDYINRGGDAKKGEGGSSRPQPPPDNQNRPGGGSGSRPDDQSRYGEISVSRDVGTRGGGSESQIRGYKSGSKRTRSSGGGESPVRGIFYGPYLSPKRDAEYWITGKKKF